MNDLELMQQEPVGEAYLCDKCHTPFDGAWECPSCGHRSATKEPVYTTPPAAQTALDKMAENERALGIQMKPCDCAAKSAADCVCGSWDSLPATPVQEPVGYMDRTKFNLLCGGDSVTTTITSHRAFAYDAPLYTAPPNMATPLAAQRPWVGLTDEEIRSVVNATVERVTVEEAVLFRAVARAIQAKLRKKNEASHE